MKFITEMPETPEVLNCEKHGTYNAQYANWSGGKIAVNTSCNQCVKEMKAREEEERKQHFEEMARERMVSVKLSRGVSKRNLNSTFDSFIASTTKQKSIKAKGLKWLESFKADKEACPSMIITGKVGTGKTYLASCIMNDLFVCAYREPKIKMIKLIDLIRTLKDTWRRDSELTELKLIEKLSTLDLLIIDEVGMGFDSDTEKLFVFDVIDGRYDNSLPTILISNLNTEGIKNSIGERSLDRLRDGGGVLLGCDWESYRK